LKKLVIICFLPCLLLGCCKVAMAEQHQKFSTEYEKDQNWEGYKFKLAYEYETNSHWLYYIRHEFEQQDIPAINYVEVKYLFPKNMVLALQYESYHSQDFIAAKFNTGYDIGKGFSAGGSISYTQYFPKADRALQPDFTELEIVGETKYRINKSLLAVINCDFTAATYDRNILNPDDNPDSHEIESYIGLEYQFIQAGRVWGRYYVYNIDYDDPARDGKTLDRFEIGGNYDFKNYSFYCSYPFPQHGNSAKLGISYRF
jgi:predicted porin